MQNAEWGIRNLNSEFPNPCLSGRQAHSGPWTEQNNATNWGKSQRDGQENWNGDEGKGS
jgi:hypothetical protein